MEGRYTEKLEQKQATSLEVIDAQKSLDGRDRQIEVANDAADSAQNTADQALQTATKAHLFQQPVAGAGPVGTGNSAASAAYEVARKAHVISDNAALGNVALYAVNVTASYAVSLANKALTLDTDHATPEFNNGNFAIYRAYNYADIAYKTAVNAGQDAAAAKTRADAAYKVGDHTHPYASSKHDHKYTEIEGAPKATGKAAGPGQHAHSISFTPFIKYPADMRRAMLSLRREVRKLVASSESKEVRLLAEAVDTAFRLQQDYIGLNAFDREERLSDPEWSEWSDNYRRVYGVDKYAEEDRSNYMGYGPIRMDPYEGIARV